MRAKYRYEEVQAHLYLLWKGVVECITKIVKCWTREAVAESRVCARLCCKCGSTAFPETNRAWIEGRIGSSC